MYQSTYLPQHRLNGLLSHIFNDNLVAEDKAQKQWIPQVDIRETETEFQMFVDLPGTDPSNVDITLDKNLLTISGKRNIEDDQSGNKLQRLERRSGTFKRQFTLPDSADGKNISAKAKQGVFEIKIPKLIKQAPVTIRIES